MSEMVRNKGIIKRLSTPETIQDVYKSLKAAGELDNCDEEFNDDGTIDYFYDSDGNYVIVNGSIFDVSGAPDESETDEEVNDAKRLNETDYLIHAYYYNGGADLSEMLTDSIPLADVAYGKGEVFYAVKMNGYRWWTRDGSPTPALFTSKEKAETTIKRHSYLKDGEYEVVEFVEVKGEQSL